MFYPNEEKCKLRGGTRFITQIHSLFYKAKGSLEAFYPNEEKRKL